MDPTRSPNFRSDCSASGSVACSASTSHSTRSASSARARARRTLLLHGIVGLANAGGVDDRNRIAIEIELHFDDVTRRAGVWRDNRDIAARQLIDQRGLADIRLPRNRNHEAVAEAFRMSLCRKDFCNFIVQRLDRLDRRRHQFRGHIALVRKIDAGFDQGRGFDDALAPVARAIAEQALQLAERLAALAIGVGVNEIVEAFGFGEVELAVLERPPRELAGLGRARIRNLRNSGEERRQYRAATMDMEFGDVLTGGACLPGNQSTTASSSGWFALSRSSRMAGLSRRRALACERRQRQSGLRPGHAHHRDRAWRTARRQREDGLVSRMHGLFVRLRAKRQTPRFSDGDPNLLRWSPRQGLYCVATYLQNFAAKFPADNLSAQPISGFT